MKTKQKSLPIQLTSLICACLLCVLCASVWADDNSEFFLLFNIDALHYTYRPNDLNVDENDLETGVDLFYVYNWEKSRVLVEYYVGSEESELERLQYNYQLTDYTTVKIGRMYTPLGYWSSRFHHGIYFQTSINRPEIVKNEDDGGILPVHITGLTLAGTTSSRASGWQYNVMLGAAPDLFINSEGEIELRPFDLLSPGNGVHNNLTPIFKLYYTTNDTLQTDSGISVQTQKLDARGAGLSYLEQNSVNLYSYLDFIDKRFIASGFYVKSILHNSSGNETAGSFINAYLQYEEDIFTHWTAYGRAENTWGESGDPYLALFPGFINRQTLLGLRYDMTENQALKLEYSDAKTASDDFNSLTLQWSAIFP